MIYVKKKSCIKKIINYCARADYAEQFKIVPLLKRLFIFSVFGLLVLYALYLFLFPVIVSENNAEKLLNAYLSKNSKLTLDVENLKLSPNYKFDINLKADYIKLKYPNGKDFIVLIKPTADINLLTLFSKYIDLNKIHAEKLTISTNFTKSNKYDCFNYFSPDIFDLKLHNSKFELRNINFLVDYFQFKLFDENIKQNFLISASRVKFSSLPSIHPLVLLNSKGKIFEITSKGEIKSSNAKISDFNLKFLYKLNPDSMSRFNSIIRKLNYNPLAYASLYNFYSKTEIDLKMIPNAKKINMDGFIKLTDYSFKVNQIRLPKNNVTLFFKGDKIFADCDFNFIKNQFIKLNAKANISKNKFLEMKLNSSDIDLQEIKEILIIFSRIFNTKFDVANIDLSGFLRADLYLKSDFKTINSSGKFEVKNVNVHDKKTGLSLKNINSNINLAGNKIDISNATAFFGESKFYLKGTIDEKTNLNLKIDSDLIDTVKIVAFVSKIPFISSFLPSLDDYIFKSGSIKISADIRGNFKKPIIKTASEMKNLKVFVKSLGLEFFTPKILISAYPEVNTVNHIFITVFNSDVKYKNHLAKIEKLSLKMLENDIKIEKTKVDVDKIPLDIEGYIKNFKSKTPIANLKIFANLPKNNPFLVVNVQKPVLEGEIQAIKNKILINNLTILSASKKIASVTGSVSDTLNIKAFIDEKTAFYLPAQKLSFEAKGNVSITGKIEKPILDGNLNLYNISLKQYNLYINDLILNIKNSDAYINIVKGKISGFNFDLVAQAKLLKDKILVDFAQVDSDYINLDSFKNVSCLNSNNLPKIEIINLKGNIMALEVMDVLLNSVYFEGGLKNDILTLNNFKADAFDGGISGSLITDIGFKKVSLDAIIKNVNVRLLTNGVKEIKNFSIAASGKLSALLKVDFKADDFDTMLKTTEGYVKFNINDGELSQFAKLERLLQAGNILSQSILKLTLNSTISSITKQNTGDFKTIEGTVKLKNSNADIQYIKTQGSNMSLYLTGTFNLLSQVANVKIFGRIPVSMVNVLGPIGRFSTEQIVNKMSDETKDVIKSITVSPLEKMMSAEISDENISKIPPLAYQNSAPTREFKVRLVGRADDARSIQYFKWRAKSD